MALIEVSRARCHGHFCLLMAWAYISVEAGMGVSIRSKVLSLRVGKSTICSRMLSATMSRKVLSSLLGYWVLEMVRSLQFMSGKLKSPLINSTHFLALDFRSENSSVTLPRYGSSDLFGGR